MTTIPAYTIGGLTRPELHLDPTGHIILDPAAQSFADTYGLQYLYLGCPPGTLWPPIPGFLSPPTDTNSGANTVVEGAAANTSVGLTAHADSLIGLPVTYSLVSDSSNGGFKVDPNTGVVSVANPAKVDFESSGGSYVVNVQATDGIFVSSQTFTIAVSNAPPSTPTDSNAAANAVNEGAAVNTLVGITASSADVNGPGVTYSLTSDSSNGGFKIDPTTGVVTVADSTKVDFESAPGHAYSITVQASDGHGGVSSQSFTINVNDVPISTPVDANPAANSVVEGAAANTLVGITASAVDPNGPPTTYSLAGDTSVGGFKIDPNTGVVSVADPTKLDYESAPGHAYTITVHATSGATTTSQTFTIGVTDAPPSAPTDTDATTNSVVEGAAIGTVVGVTAHSTDINGGPVTYSLIGDAHGFTINAATGVISVADPTKIDYETSGPGHAYTITAQASDGTLTSTQTFTIGVTDVAPSTPVDVNAAANSVVEGAAAGTAVGITASSTDVNGPAVIWSLTSDSSLGGFGIDPNTGVITVADPTKIDYEGSGPTHSYTVTAQASDGAGGTSTQSFTIAVNDAPPSAPVDTDSTVNAVVEGAAAGTTVGITASSTDVNGPPVTWTLIGDTSVGGFTINSTTGVISVADPTKIDYETSGPGHSYTVTAQASDGLQASSQTFTIAVTDVAPSTPVDTDVAINTVVEGAAAGSTVGITASSTDVNGPAVTWSLVGDSHGFTINATTGVVTVADPSQIDYESSGPGHAYTITAQASDGTLASTQAFTIDVTNAPPSTPIDNDVTANTVVEGAAIGTTVGVTALATDPGGSAVTWSLTGDSSLGGFGIDANTGVITVVDPTKLNYESSGPTHSYTVIAQASDGAGGTSSQSFTIAVTDAPPSTPVDTDLSANTVVEGAAIGTTVGVTASSIDVNGPPVTWSLTGDAHGFAIDPNTGVITVADPTKIDYETSGPGHAYTITAQADDGAGGTSSQTFTIAVTDVAPSTPVDSDGAVNQVSQNAPVGSYTGLTASSVDVNGPAVTYTIVTDTSNGGFAVDPSTGQVTVADSTKIPYNPASPSYDVTVQASDGTDTSQQTFTINVIQNTPPVANDDAVSATEAGGLNNTVPGTNPSGNVILGTGAAGAVQDTDTQDASSALKVVAVHTGPEGGSTGTGTVGLALVGLHGTLTLNADGSYTYSINQTDAAVQGLHTSADTLTDVFNYTIADTGGLQDTATLTITIHGADDLPQAVADTGTMTEDAAPTSFNVIANDTKDPDSTAANTISLSGGITVTGPAGETFANSDATASIVNNQVQVTLNNAAFQQLAVGEHATVIVPYTLTGDAGETSTANLTVTVNGVDDLPVAVDDSGSMTEDQSGHAFTVLTNDTLDADHGAPNNVTVGAVANLVAPSGEGIDLSDISVSVNASNQVVVNLGADFQKMQDGETATFDVPYTLHGDQGATSNATLHVTVNGANDAPVVTNVTFNGANSATGNTDLVVNDPADGAPSTTGPFKLISGSLLSGATDVDGPGPLVVQAGTFATAHGTVTIQSDGDFVYKPAVGYTGTDTFTYHVSDQNAGASGPGIGTGTVTINVAAPKVWYVNADAATDGDGSSENPFNNLSHFNGAGGVDGAGDTIFLESSSGHYTAPAGGLQLENGEQLISQSAGLTVPDGGAGTVTLVSASGANAVIDGGVILGSNNNIQGVDFGSSSTFALSGANVGTATIDNIKSGVINNTGTGGAVSITGSGNALNMDFSSVTSSGGTNGIVINGASGTFHAHGGAISNSSGSDVSLSSGSLNFAYDGTISDNTGSTVSVASMTGGTQSFTGAISSNGGTGIGLTSNTGATINFTGGMNLSTGASTAFSATGGGTVNVTGSNNALTTSTGTALDVENTQIGSSNLTFKSITSNGGSNNGIILSNTGTAAGNGGLHVTGDGSTAGSGGTIANKTGADGSTTQGSGIYLNNTKDVELSYLAMHDFQNYGIVGTNVTGFTIGNTTVTGTNGTNVGGIGEGDVYFTGLSGTASVTNSTFTGAALDAFHVFNNGGQTLNRITITGSTFATNTAAGNQSGDALVFQATDGTFNATIQGNSFTSARGDLFQLDLHGGVSSDLVLGGATPALGNSFSNNNQNIVSGGGGITISSGGAGDHANLTFNISNNTMRDALGTALGISTGSGASSFTGTIDSNTIGVAGVANSGSAQGSDIGFVTMGGANSSVTITNNHLYQYNDDGIYLQTGDAVDGGNALLTAIVMGNTASNPGAFGNHGFELNAGTIGTPADAQSVSLTLGGTGAQENQFLGSGANGGTDIRLRDRFNTTVGLHAGDGSSYGGGATDTAAISSYVLSHNTVTTAPSISVAAGSTNGFGASPLLAEDGGVQAAVATPGETHLTQSQLDSVVSVAIHQWAAAGISGTQLAALQAVTFSVADLAGQVVGLESAGHITIDSDAAGHGWFIDPTPGDNFEFTQALNASGTDLLTSSSTAAAGHLDLLTAVVHELGHVLGLPDSSSPADVHDLMYIGLSDGERKLPGAADVAQANGTTATAGHTQQNFVFTQTDTFAGQQTANTAPAILTHSDYFASFAQNAQTPSDLFSGQSNAAPWWTGHETQLAAMGGAVVDNHIQVHHDLIV
ncbi:cadherin domain-containing protein [Bradyrhizobium mercantei]|uniref:cadherin domain-containing protein n=1 Tax=Bradyrhizobium mercantei TaxID=1904807 RepID=UPI0009785C39|nr:cadherin domain-containing protein [Bradyrhizobium mercantei]